MILNSMNLNMNMPSFTSLVDGAKAAGKWCADTISKGVSIPFEATKKVVAVASQFFANCGNAIAAFVTAHAKPLAISAVVVAAATALALIVSNIFSTTANAAQPANDEEVAEPAAHPSNEVAADQRRQDGLDGEVDRPVDVN